MNPQRSSVKPQKRQQWKPPRTPKCRPGRIVQWWQTHLKSLDPPEKRPGGHRQEDAEGPKGEEPPGGMILLTSSSCVSRTALAKPGPQHIFYHLWKNHSYFFAFPIFPLDFVGCSLGLAGGTIFGWLFTIVQQNVQWSREVGFFLFELIWWKWGLAINESPVFKQLLCTNARKPTLMSHFFPLTSARVPARVYPTLRLCLIFNMHFVHPFF